MNRFKSVKIASILGIACNIFLLVIKAIIGFYSKSQAMIADSINSAGDVLSSLFTFIGNHISNKPSDEDHNFGHGKSEYIFSLLISILMVLVSMKLLHSALVSLIYKSTFEFSIYLIVVCIITILTKFALYVYTNRLGKKHNSILLKANSKDHICDCLITTFTLISALLALIGIYWFDGVTGIGISIWILYVGIKIFIESYNVLMDISIDSVSKDKIISIISKYQEIKKIEDLFSTPSGYKYVITVTIFVDGNMSIFGSHKLTNNLEKEIKALDNISDVVIHVHPV